MDVKQWEEFCEKEVEPGPNASDPATHERFRKEFFELVDKYVRIPEACEKKLLTIDGTAAKRSTLSTCSLLLLCSVPLIVAMKQCGRRETDNLVPLSLLLGILYIYIYTYTCTHIELVTMNSMLFFVLCVYD